MWEIKDLISDDKFDDKTVIKKLEETVNCYFKDENKNKKEEYNDFYWTLYEKMYGKHFNETLLKKAISEMEFVNPDYKPKYTKEQIKSAIEQAYKIAEQNYAKKGIIAPKIKDTTTLCDMEYVFNMISADYGMSHTGDITKISLMSYEFLSDPDAPDGKAYLYYCAMAD